MNQAQQSDIYELYIEGIQEPDDVAYLVNQIYQQYTPGPPQYIREDFCGTAINCIEWLKRNPNGYATAIDIDPEPLRWASYHLLSDSDEYPSSNLDLVRSDARIITNREFDVLLSLNSSVCYFHTRKELLQYLQICRMSLADHGLLFLEIYAGPEAQGTGCDRLELDNFTLIWDQAEFNSMTHECVNHIHFEFPDGSRIDRAFTYHFRLWTVPEILDAAREAGFNPFIYPIHDDSYTKLPDTFEPVNEVTYNDYWTPYIVCSPITQGEMS